MADSNYNISYGSRLSKSSELILFDKKYSSRKAIETKAIRHYYQEREMISYTILFFSFFPILFGISRGLIFIRPFDIIFTVILSNCMTIPVAGLIYPYWWGHIKITDARIIFREEPFMKFNIFSTREFIFSSDLIIKYNIKTNRLTFQNDEKVGLLILEGLSIEDIKEFWKILGNIKKIDIIIETGEKNNCIATNGKRIISVENH